MALCKMTSLRYGITDPIVKATTVKQAKNENK